MKKLFTIMCAMALVVGLTAGQVFAIGYCKDMNPADPKDKTFEDEITIDVFYQL